MSVQFALGRCWSRDPHGESLLVCHRVNRIVCTGICMMVSYTVWTFSVNRLIPTEVKKKHQGRNRKSGQTHFLNCQKRCLDILRKSLFSLNSEHTNKYLSRRRVFTLKSLHLIINTVLSCLFPSMSSTWTNLKGYSFVLAYIFQYNFIHSLSWEQFNPIFCK